MYPSAVIDIMALSVLYSDWCEECLLGARKGFSVRLVLIDGICDSEGEDHLSLLMLCYHLPCQKTEEFERVSFISHSKKVYVGHSQKRLPDDNDTLCLILQRTNSARLYFIIVY